MKDPQLLYGIDDKPSLRESIALGFQHYLTMFGSTVAARAKFEVMYREY